MADRETHTRNAAKHRERAIVAYEQGRREAAEHHSRLAIAEAILSTAATLAMVAQRLDVRPEDVAIAPVPCLAMVPETGERCGLPWHNEEVPHRYGDRGF